jgi:hypothetical protein
LLPELNTGPVMPPAPPEAASQPISPEEESATAASKHELSKWFRLKESIKLGLPLMMIFRRSCTNEQRRN